MKKIPYKTKDVLICDCNSDEHQYLIYYSEDEYENGTKIPICHIHPHLVRRSFWYRLKYGIKYIFGYKSRYGAWDEFLLNPQDADKLQDVVNYLKKIKL